MGIDCYDGFVNLQRRAFIHRIRKSKAFGLGNTKGQNAYSADNVRHRYDLRDNFFFPNADCIVRHKFVGSESRELSRLGCVSRSTYFAQLVKALKG